MKLNYDASKKEWRKLRAKPVTENDEAALPLLAAVSILADVTSPKN